MAVGSDEQFDTFEYIKPADYLPALENNYREQNEGFARAEEMARINDAQRLADAKNFGRVIEEAQQFSKTLADEWEKKRDEKDLLYRNENTSLALRADISLEDWQEYKTRMGDLATEQGFYTEVAQQFKETDYELYQQLTSLTGFRAVSFKRNLLRQAALNYTDNFNENIYNQKDDGSYQYSVTLKDGRNINYLNAQDKHERDLVIDEYNRQTGLSDVSWANSRFLKSEFQPIYDKQILQIRNKWTQNKKTEDDENRLKTYDDQLILAASPELNDLGAEVEKLLTTEYGEFGGDRAAARAAIANRLAYLVSTDQIPAHALVGIHEHLMESEHSSTGKRETLGFFKEFREDTLLGLIVEKQQAQNEAKLGIIQQRKTAFDIQVQKQIAELGRPPTEAEALEILMMWKRDPINAGIEPTEFIKNLVKNTLEDRNDDEIITYHTAMLYAGNTPPPEVINQIQDPTKRENFKKLVDGFGLTKDQVSTKNARIKDAILEKLGITEGVSGNINDEDYLIRSPQALAYFDQRYRELEGKVEESKRYGQALQETLDIIKGGGFATETDYRDSDRKFTKRLNKVKKNILEQKNNGVDLNRYLSSAIIPGTEEDFKRLESYAKNPYGNRIPFFYKELARDMKVSKNGVTMTGWHIANLQYKAVTGKELPKPNSVFKLETGSPMVQYLRTWKNNKWNTRNANYIEQEGGDYSNPETITPGLIPVEAIA